jgi:hypothetical protein
VVYRTLDEINAALGERGLTLGQRAYLPQGHHGVHRPSGAENRLNKQCKEMLATCFESVGGLPGLVKWVKESPQNRGAFYTRMWVRLVGLDVHIKDEHKNVVYRTLDEINAALGEQGLTLEMLERLCRYEDEQPRLIEHVRVGLAPKPRRCRSSMPLFCGSGNLTSIAEALRFLAIPVGADEQEFAAGWRAMPSLSQLKLRFREALILSPSRAATFLQRQDPKRTFCNPNRATQSKLMLYIAAPILFG